MRTATASPIRRVLWSASPKPTPPPLHLQLRIHVGSDLRHCKSIHSASSTRRHAAVTSHHTTSCTSSVNNSLLRSRRVFTATMSYSNTDTGSKPADPYGHTSPPLQLPNSNTAMQIQGQELGRPRYRREGQGLGRVHRALQVRHDDHQGPGLRSARLSMHGHCRLGMLLHDLD